MNILEKIFENYINERLYHDSESFKECSEELDKYIENLSLDLGESVIKSNK